MSAQVKIPKERSYKIPAGQYHSTIEHVTVQKAKSGQGQACVIHLLSKVPGMERYDCCARAIFPLDLRPGSQLRTVLEGLLGPKYLAEQAGETIDLKNVLQGKDCVIDVMHGPHNEEKYDYPMVIVESLKPVTANKEENTNK